MKNHLIPWCLALFFTVQHLAHAEAPPPPTRGGGSSSGRSGGPTLPSLYVGGIVGIAYPPKSIGATSRLNLGGTFGFRISRNLGLGIYFMQALKNEATGYPVPYDKSMIKILTYGGEINYWFKADRFAFRIGYRMGPSQVYIEPVAAAPVSTNPTHFGPVGSIDFFLGKEVSIGIEGDFLFFGDLIENAPFVTYYFNSSLKLWF